MTGDALAEMEHKHALDTICRINGRQLAWVWAKELNGGSEGGKAGGRRRGGRKLESREGLTISHCSTGVFKYHHRVWLRHEGWESSVDQRLFKQLSLSFFFCFFSFSSRHIVVLLGCGLIGAERFKTMKKEINKKKKKHSRHTHNENLIWSNLLLLFDVWKYSFIFFIGWCIWVRNMSLSWCSNYRF